MVWEWLPLPTSLWVVRAKHGVNSIPELELMDNSNSEIGYLKKIGNGIDEFVIGIWPKKIKSTN